MIGWLKGWATEWFGPVNDGLPKGQQYVPWHGRDGYHQARTPNIFPLRGRHGKYLSRFKVS